MASNLESLDKQIAQLLSDWSLTTTALALLIVALLVYPLIYSHEPDAHPLLLARQVLASPVRNKGESAVYRSPEVPHGNPLRTGLNVKDPAAPRWAGGKDGDLRDVWREVQRGGSPGLDGKVIPRGLIMSVFGSADVVEHDVDDLSKEISLIGKQFKDGGVGKVGIYLPNSIEYLQALFACSFYGLSPVLLPFHLPSSKVAELLNATRADGLIAAAGTVPVGEIAADLPHLKLLVWVVEKTSIHMDWDGVPEPAQGRLSVRVWHDVVGEGRADASPQLPSNQEGDKPGDVITIWQSTDQASKADIVTFTQANMVAGIGALISAIPYRQRFGSADLVVPADMFAHNYVLSHTLAALLSHASLAITSVAFPGVDFSLARRGVAPTIMIVSAETMAKLHQDETGSISTGLQRFGKYTQDQTIAAGRMPANGIFFRLLAPSSSQVYPGKLRLILTSERVGGGSPPLTSSMLSDLRIFTRSRIIYALTAAPVAGAVAQTNLFDYRQDAGSQHSHFGIPLSSVEVKLLSAGDDAAVADASPQGEILVNGPAVSGEWVRLSAGMGRFREDGTLAFA